ncbi:hypothetical protein [Vibrio porteresiae]|uniref:Uncharacterized protein n=1 Tax=Vibrio porteresiae DSM 19223 TaxID=1123496 RepID=A0ABZ0QHS6_9VIBR|nr:hypothetical protein [Vibrio porteresiae]WPC76044.1 hypothetical protein R8Z52_24335 [Vibrio porteresiae DSM 19223]
MNSINVLTHSAIFTTKDSSFKINQKRMLDAIINSKGTWGACYSEEFGVTLVNLINKTLTPIPIPANTRFYAFNPHVEKITPFGFTLVLAHPDKNELFWQHKISPDSFTLDKEFTQWH